MKALTSLTTKPMLNLGLVAGFALATSLLFISPKTAQAAGVEVEAQDAGRVIGNPKAPITVVEYASLTCPHCAEFANNIMPKLKTEWIDSGKVKWVFRDYPLDGTALKAAVIIRCAPADRFYNFVGAFYTNQQNWARAADPVATLTRLAKLGGVGEEKIKACLANKKIEDAVLQQQLDGKNRYAVNATPTIFINGKISKNFTTWEGFESELKSAAQ